MKVDDSTIDVVAHALCRAHADAMGTDHDSTIEDWHAVARAAIDLGARPARVDRRERLAELLGSDSTNFLGTGLTMRDFMQLHDAEKIARSWALQSREERRRRLSAIMRLSIELGHIRATTEFSTRLAEMAIEAVIEGDWKMVEEWAEDYSFSDDNEDIQQKYAPVFAIFRELLLQVLRAAKEVPA